MTSPFISADAVEQTARLTERLQYSVETQQSTAVPPPEPSRSEIIEDLNATIHEIITDTPLMLPEPISVPEDRRPQAVAPQDDGDHLSHWLSRQPEEVPERRPRSQIVTMCLGTMFLSILAGYGSAQLLNIYLDREATSSRDWKPTAAGAGLTLDWSNIGEKVPFSSEHDPGRVRVAPSQKINAVDQFTSSTPSTPAIPVSLNDAPTPGANVSKQSLPNVTAFAAASSDPDDSIFEAIDELPPSFDDEPTTEQVPEPKEVQPAKTPSTTATDDAARMLERADRLIGNGDIAGARLILRHLAEAGDGPAALKLAQAYDPEWLAANGGGGVPANLDFALRWYAMARDRGEAGANDRMETLEALK